MATNSITAYPAEFLYDDYSYASIVSGYPVTNPIGKPSSNTSMVRVNLKTGSGAESWIFYRFDLSSIPQNATINSISCSAKAYISQTNTNRVSTRQCQLFSGNTAKGSATSISTSTSSFNMTVGTWTRTELNDCRIRVYAKRGSSNTTTTYYMGLYGATLTISYTWEDITYTITTNCSNGTISPNNPTVQQYGSQKFTLTGNNAQDELTSLKLGNTDVLSQAVKISRANAFNYTVETAPSASYGYNLSGNYYVSTNKGVSDSAAVARVSFNFPVECTVTFYVINYAEATYDYGILSNIDFALSTTSAADSSGYYWRGNTTALNTPSEQAVTYTVPSGSHFIDVKFKKDTGTNSNNDTLQFRIVVTPNSSYDTNGYYYEYTLSNATASTTLTAVFASQKIMYIKNNGTWTVVSAVYKKINGSWVQQTDLESLFNTNTNYLKG